MTVDIVLASRNKKKIAEMEALLSAHVPGVHILSLDDIGKYFDNRDHSTVLYSIQQVEKKMKTDASFAEMVKEIKTNINSKR